MWISSVVNIDWPSKASRPPGPDRGPAGRVPPAARPGRAAASQRRRGAGPAHRRRVLALAVRALVGIPDRRTRPGPGLGPAGLPGRRVAQAEPGVPRLVQPVPRSPCRPPAAPAPTSTKLAPGHPARQHPGLDLRLPAAGVAGSRLYYNPGIPEVREFVQTAMMDAVKRYDIDGVHFDDYFYPYPAALPGLPDDATFAAVRRRLHRPGRLAAGQHRPADPGDERQDQGGEAVGEVRRQPVRHLAEQAADPLGSDTTGSQSYDTISADTRKWVKQEWIDYVVPQLYWYIGQYPAADYARLVPGGPRRCAAPACSSTSARPTTRAATRRTGRTGRTPASCPTT